MDVNGQKNRELCFHWLADCGPFYQFTSLSVIYSRELQLGGTVCIETKSKNGKRLMRRVRVVNKAEHLQPYLKRVCEVVGCCPELISGTRYPLGYCSQTCCLKGKYKLYIFFRSCLSLFSTLDGFVKAYCVYCVYLLCIL